MTAEIINGNKIAADIEKHIKADIKELDQSPTLGVVLIGNNKASKTYIKKKRKKAQELNCGFKLFDYPKNVTQDKLIKDINKIQKQNKADGIIIQLPIPERLYPNLLDAIRPEFDIDCLGSQNLGKLIKGKNQLTPPTASAIMEIFKRINVNLKGKKVTIVGTGILVGKPTAILAMNKQATVTTCNIHTKNLKSECLDSDIIICGAGQKDLITKDIVSENVVVIDAGVDYKDGKTYGDVKFDEVKEKASCITPTPGGLGPITVAKLFENLVQIS